MQISIEKDQQGSGWKVVIDGHAISFASAADAEAYVARLQERLQAAPHAFAAPEACA